MEPITVQTTIQAPIDKVWEYFTKPEHITGWNNASADWHTPRAENDLKVGGTFNIRMESRDGKEGFDFTGIYDEVVPSKIIRYTMSDGRKVSVAFQDENGATKVVETFVPETENTPEVQRSGWQSILDNFKKYTETH